MLIQILIGSLLIIVSILIETVFIAVAVAALTRKGEWLISGSNGFRLVITLTAMTLWLLIALSLAIWMWAFLFFAIDVFQTLEAALYFSVVAFTTLGFGDITLPLNWRLLSGFIAANGLVLFGLNTAFLIEAMQRIRHAQENNP